MYNSDYIALTEGDKRITLNRLIACYKYSNSYIHNYTNSARIVVYGILDGIEELIGSYYLITNKDYLANDYASSVSGLFECSKEYEYLRLQIIDEYDNFLGIESEIHGVITISELELVDDYYILTSNVAGIIITIDSPVIDEVVGNYVLGGL